MATIIVEGLVLEVRPLENSKVGFTLSENVGTRENPIYQTFECLTNLSERQKEHLYKNKIVQVVGDLKILKVTKEEKVYINNNIYVYNIDFKGDAKPKVENEAPNSADNK